MLEFLLEQLSFLTETTLGQILLTVLISMVPVVELRGAIPAAIGLGLHPAIAVGAAIVGNLIPVPFIIVFIRKIFLWMRKHMPKLNRLIDRLEAKGESKREAVLKSEFWGLFAFVAIPLPGTGAWTGALIAAMLNMRLKRAFPAIVFGVFVAGIAVSAISLGLFTLFAA